SLYRLNFWFILPTDVFDHFRDTRAQSNYFPRSLDFTVDSRYIEPEGARLTQAMIAAGFSPPVSM
ncbi:MAG: hypothetical protein LBJ77_02240, partial [Holosporales bacterium]|nr:hypothetical protein [Holosporales bacterium]